VCVRNSLSRYDGAPLLIVACCSHLTTLTSDTHRLPAIAFRLALAAVLTRRPNLDALSYACIDS
jgi:hypothetical protein